MRQSNPIFLSIERAVQEKLAAEQFEMGWEKLRSDGLSTSDINDAGDEISRVVAFVPLGGLPSSSSVLPDGSLLKDAQLYVALKLIEHGQPPGLSLAMQYCQEVRHELDTEVKTYALSLFIEGRAAMKLADVSQVLGQSAIQAFALLGRTSTLFQQARECCGLAPFEIGEILLREASLHFRMGAPEFCHAVDSDNAVMYVKRALRLCQQARRCFPPLSPDVGLALSREAFAHQLLSGLEENPVENLNAALDLLQAAERCFEPESRFVGKILYNMGHCHAYLADLGVSPEGNLKKVLSIFQRARSYFRPDDSYHSGLFSGEATARAGLSALGIDPIDNSQQAINLYQQGRRWILPGTSPFAGICVQEAGECCRLADLGVDPITHLNRALQLFRKARKCFEPDTLHFIAICIYEAYVSLSLAEMNVEAHDNLQRARKYSESAVKRLKARDLERRRAIRILAKVLWRMGHLEKAYRWLKEGITTIEHHRAQKTPESWRIDFFERNASDYISIVKICLQLADAAEMQADADGWRTEAWHWVHRCKNRTLIERLANSLPDSHVADAKLWADFEAQVRELSQLERLSNHPSTADAESYQTRLPSVQKAYQRARNAVFECIESNRAPLAVDVPKPKEIKQQLQRLAHIGSKTAGKPLFVEYFVTSEHDVEVFLVPLWEDQRPCVERFTVEHASLPQMAETLSKASRVLRPLTRGRSRGELVPLPEAEETALAQFEQLPKALEALVAPWADHLSRWQPTQLIISPHSWLSLLPLHAAIWDGQPLISKFPVVYLPSPALAGEFAKRRKRLGGNALLLGNPTGDLRHAEAEVRTVADRLSRHGIRTHIFIGEDARTQRAIDHAPSAGIYHVASHAQLSVTDFHLSGLELADRRLTVMEIMNRIELSKVALVYLSSCDSAAPSPEYTDELMAVVRSFLYAGAPTVIASLWPLDDRFARVFAEAFYERWIGEGYSIAKAFQEAMKDTQFFGGNPFYWAPFVLIGAW